MFTSLVVEISMCWHPDKANERAHEEANKEANKEVLRKSQQFAKTTVKTRQASRIKSLAEPRKQASSIISVRKPPLMGAVLNTKTALNFHQY